MNLGALFPNLGEPAPSAAPYPGTTAGFGGWWIWILIILALFYLLRRPGFGGLGLSRPGYGIQPGFGGGGFFGGY